MRARCAPRQKWAPPPKARWSCRRGGCRSDRGRGNAPGRGCAAASIAHIIASFGISLPPNSVSSCRMRTVSTIGPVVAQALLDGAARSARVGAQLARAASGWRSSAQTPLPIRPMVVSKPAISRPIDCEISSLGAQAVAGLLGADQRRSGCRRRGARGARRSAPGSRRAAHRPRRIAALRSPRAARTARRAGGSRRAVHTGEAVAVGERHAHHLADHRRRHRQGEIGDHVHLARAGDAVEALVDDALHVRAQARRSRAA